MVLGIIPIADWCFDHSENRWWFQTLEKSNSCGNTGLYCSNSFLFEVECKGFQGSQISGPSSGEVESLIEGAPREVVGADHNRSEELLLCHLNYDLILANLRNLVPP